MSQPAELMQLAASVGFLGSSVNAKTPFPWLLAGLLAIQFGSVPPAISTAYSFVEGGVAKKTLTNGAFLVNEMLYEKTPVIVFEVLKYTLTAKAKPPVFANVVLAGGGAVPV